MCFDKILRELRMQGQNDEDTWVCVLDGPTADKIITLLKAGQGMRELLSDGFNACRAWDAATKEDV